MTNEEMMRPCTLWGETFDAGDVLQVRNTETHVFIDLNTVKLINGHPVFGKVIASPFYDECHVESQKYTLEAITTIADALNAPVLATEEVLAGLPKDAEIWVVESFSSEYGERITYDKATYGKWYDQEDYKYYGSSWVYKCFYNTVHHKQDDIHIEYPMRIQDGYKLRIIADKDDPKTADYLRQFTLEGVRKETKDV